jgi:hypothetical protein
MSSQESTKDVIKEIEHLADQAGELFCLLEDLNRELKDDLELLKLAISELKLFMERLEKLLSKLPE